MHRQTRGGVGQWQRTLLPSLTQCPPTAAAHARSKAHTSLLVCLLTARDPAYSTYISLPALYKLWLLSADLKKYYEDRISSLEDELCASKAQLALLAEDQNQERK